MSRQEKAKMSQHFKLLNSVKVNDEIPVKKYVSSETGIQVYVAQVNSPLTNAYLALGEKSISKLWICFV